MKKYFNIIVVIILLAAVISLSMLSAVNTFQEQNFDACPIKDYCILIDAGHGGEDGGASGINTDAKESDINLAIVLDLKACFESEGTKVVLTRENADALSGSGKFNKQQDMAQRAKMIDDIKPNIVISIHCNSYPDASVKGAQAFYYPGSKEGQLLSESIRNSLVELVDKNNKRTTKEEDFFMLRNGNSVNVMVECGFLTCPSEETLLLNEEYQKKLAYAIFDGTVKYINSKE